MARILVIEDEPTIGYVLKKMLERQTHEVTCVQDGAEGRDQVFAKPGPELVILDLFLPGVNGREIVRDMRSHPPTQDVPVILITGAVPSEEDFPKAGSYQAFFAKPFDPIELIDKAEKLLATNSQN